jgi:hypothetical protein
MRLVVAVTVIPVAAALAVIPEEALPGEVAALHFFPVTPLIPAGVAVRREDRLVLPVVPAIPAIRVTHQLFGVKISPAVMVVRLGELDQGALMVTPALRGTRRTHK